MTTSPHPRAGRGHPRDQGLVRASHRRAAGLPALRLCRLRQDHHHRASPSTSSASTPMDRDGGCAGGVLYAAFTGKAALVMTRKGTPASTIHSLIYRVLGGDAGGDRAGRAGVCRPARRPRRHGPGRACLRRDADPPSRAAPRATCTSRASCSTSSRCCATPTSSCSTRSRWSARRWRADLLAFGKPILVLGDPGQLPPIKGEGAFTDAATRRDADRDPPSGRRRAPSSASPPWRGRASRSPSARMTPSSGRCARGDVAPEQLLHGGQVICGRNDTRRMLNAAMKQAAGFAGCLSGGPRREDHLPEEPPRPRAGQRHVPRARRHPRTRTSTASAPRPRPRTATTIPGRQRFYKGHFDDHVSLDPDRDRPRLVRQARADRDRLGLRHHLPQGAGLAVGERHRLRRRLGRTAEDRARWLYTAITRAERGLVILLRPRH